MSYFKDFAYTYYKFDDSINIVTNITANVDFDKNLKDNQAVWLEYDIQDGESPEMIASKLYSDPEKHWIILHLNNIVNPYYDWPMLQRDVYKYSQKKYDSIHDIHHYELADGTYVDANTLDSIPITNYEYEEALNDTKRTIKLVAPEYVDYIQEQLKTVME